MENSKRGTIPMQEKLKLSKSDGASTPTEKRHMSNVSYASIVGSIMYALRVSCYTNVGYLTDADELKSQTGYVFVLNEGVVDWKSTKQSISTASSTDVEYIAAFDASKEAVWIRKFISGLNVNDTIRPFSRFNQINEWPFPKVRVLLDVSIASMNADCNTNSQVGAVEEVVWTFVDDCGSLTCGRAIDIMQLTRYEHCTATNELDMMIARLYTRCQDIISLRNAYYVNAVGTMGASGLKGATKNKKYDNICGKKVALPLSFGSMHQPLEVTPAGRPNEVWALDMVFQDPQGNRVQGTIRNQNINKFQLLIDEGSCYRISNFGVGDNGGKYPLLNHRYKLNFYKNTTITRVANFDNNTRGFKFKPFSNFTARKFFETEVVDVIGTVVSITDLIPFNNYGVDKIRRTLVLEDFDYICLYTLHIAHLLILVAEELNDEYIDNEADDEYDYLDSFINDGPIVDEPTEDDVSDSD
ncbi:replication protein A 70 kDa DNA-binding subunit B [Tanacetum coccineum]